MKKALLLSAVALAMSWTFWPQPGLSHEVVTTTVTYDREIVRIVQKKCLACHSQNNLAMPFTTYEETRPWARAIEEEILRRHMPPWRAAPGYGPFANNVALTNRELQFLVAWIEGNGPKSKDQRIIVNFDQNQTPPSQRLTLDVTAWQLGTPDLLKALPANSIGAGQNDEVRRVVLDLGFTSDRWVRALEFKPGDRRVVRAAFFSLQETGQWLGSWTPWYGVTMLPQDSAYLLPAGSHVVAEIHYRGTNQPVEDKGSLGIYFAKAAGPQVLSDLIVNAKPENNGEALPEGQQKFSGSAMLADDTNVLAFKPDLPPGIQSIEVTARKPDGDIRVLLLVRDAMPEWPTPYILQDPLMLPKNTELAVTAYSVPTRAPAPNGVKLTVSVARTKAPAAPRRGV